MKPALIILPDFTKVLFYEDNWHFKYLHDNETFKKEDDVKIFTDKVLLTDSDLIRNRMEFPSIVFEDAFCIRDTILNHYLEGVPQYTPNEKVSFDDLQLITKYYNIPRFILYKYQTYIEWQFLDGGIIMAIGKPYWKSPSWARILGAEVLRVVCMFLGVKQPHVIHGESTRRPLGQLLEELNRFSLNMNGVKMPNSPRENQKSIFSDVWKSNDFTNWCEINNLKPCRENAIIFLFDHYKMRSHRPLLETNMEIPDWVLKLSE
jgi:hypothetical protein